MSTTPPGVIAVIDQIRATRQTQLDLLLATWHQLALDETAHDLHVGYASWLHHEVTADNLADLLTAAISRIAQRNPMSTDQQLRALIANKKRLGKRREQISRELQQSGYSAGDIAACWTNDSSSSGYDTTSDTNSSPSADC